MSRRGYGGGAFGLGLDYKDLKEIQLDIDGKRTMALPVNGPLNEAEKITCAQFIHFQELMKDGPFFTGSSLSAKGAVDQVEDVGINDGIKRYSDRYAKKRKISRSIKDHPFKIEFLPAELHAVINTNSKVRKNALKLSSYQSKSSKFYLDSLNGDENGGENGDQDDFSKQLLSKFSNIVEVEDDKDKKEDQEQDLEEEEEDDFDDDDDDDYNAEKYFDDGEDFGDDGDGNDDEAAF